jgi:salicylate hydroxylase
VPASQTIIIIGAGIGGLTAALALARRGLRVRVFDQADPLEQVGAGLQLSPNASRILIELGMAERLAPLVVAPEHLRVRDAQSGRVLALSPLGPTAAQHYGAPYWVIHRGDLQAQLLAAITEHPDIVLHLGARVDDYEIHPDGLSVAAATARGAITEHGAALIGADGLWSRIRHRLGHEDAPKYSGQSAWRALVPAADVAAELAAPVVDLWLGRDAHLVHYPVRAGREINVVAIARDAWRGPDWNEPAGRDDIAARFPAAAWAEPARTLLANPPHWRKWALHDRDPVRHWGKAAVTLLGDAAHPMLPYLAQGAAMAIEDAAVLAERIAARPDDITTALRRYEAKRFARTARTQMAARRNGAVYHMRGIGALMRMLAIRATGNRLVRRYDWIYGWTPDGPTPR